MAIFVEDALFFAIKGNGKTPANNHVYSEGEPVAAAADQCYYPMVLMDEVHSEGQADLDGNTGVVKAEYDLDCRAITALKARETAKAVQNIINNFCGTLAGLKIKRISAKITGQTWHPQTKVHKEFFVCTLTTVIWYFDPSTIVNLRPSVY